jgi:hypothetical protein
MVRSIATGLVLAAAVAVAGCAAAPKAPSGPAESKAADHDEVLTPEQVLTPEEADALLASAEEEIATSLGVAVREPAAAPAAPTPPAPAQPPDAPSARPADRTGAGKEAETLSAQEPACTRACRALAAMQRAASRLCALAGDGDPRCAAAQARLGAARAIVRRSCPDCP